MPACSQPPCVSCVPLPVACAGELTPKWVIQMSRLWPGSLFVLAVTSSLSLCQDYPLRWVLPLMSLGRVTLRHLLASWCHARHVPSTGTSHGEIWAQGKKQACSCSARSYRSDHLQVHKTRAWLFLRIEFGFIPVYINKGSYSLREVDSCSMFLLPFYSSSSWHFPGSCHPRIFEWIMCINVFKHQCTPVIFGGHSEKCSYTVLLPVCLSRFGKLHCFTFWKTAQLGRV